MQFGYVSPEQIMKDRADYARKGIARGRSVVVIQFAGGILFAAESPSPSLHKISEIYDRIAFAAVGKYNEFENLRQAGVRLADLRGYSFDRVDVSGRQLANVYAQTLGTIFTQEPKPYEVERRVRIVGDPSVATVAVDGQHTVRREGSTLHVAGESELIPTDGAFTLLAGGRWREVADRFHNVGQDLELRVRVNPGLAVGAEAIAGSLQVDEVPALDHVRVTAGSLRVRGLQSPVDLLVQAGSAQVETRQLGGRSRMRCESGSLQLTLLDGSDVRVRSDVQLGRFTTDPDRRARDRARDVVLGTGAAEIDVEVVMGNVTVELPDSERRDKATR